MRLGLAERLQGWRGPMRADALASWLQVLDVQAAPPIVEVAPAAAPVRTPATDLRSLVSGAPTEFCCALDGRLLVDPVQAPTGYVFERSTLARALEESGGRCPLTGVALELNQCQRSTELRTRIVMWVRQSRPRQRAS
mmetsp:Transcript_36610/g.77918  ORF Transcript_36610/g.77918 Transcript_36610/m.77918 type:complete len:138 (+) Transcript_36610:1-414(+)